MFRKSIKYALLKSQLNQVLDAYFRKIDNINFPIITMLIIREEK